jgi:DNA-binding NarL/FixJ family response regulator
VSAPITIVVADDHNLFRSGVVELLESVPEFEIVGEAATGDAAISLSAGHKPHILILDVEMPGPGSVATIHKVTEASPGTRVIVLTMHDDPDLVRTLFDAGAAGYLIKSSGRQELVAAISAACRDENSVVLAVSRQTLLGLGSEAVQARDASLLSPREIEILLLVADARSNRDIATALYISEGTVKRHLANVYSKLGATSRIDAVRKALVLGAIPDVFVKE